MQKSRVLYTIIPCLWFAGCGATEYRNPLDTTPVFPYEQAEGLRISAQPTSGAVNSVLSNFQVQFINGSRVVPVVGPIMLSLNPNPSNAVLGGTTTVSSSDQGTANFSDLTISKKGNFRIQASASTVNPVVSQLIRIGNNSFSTTQVTSLGNSAAVLPGPAQIHSADLNNDGFLDLVCSYPNNVTPSQPLVSSYLGDGTGQFGTPQNLSLPAGSQPSGFAIGDWNRDGKPDLAVCLAGSNRVQICLGNGDGSFVATTTLAVGTSPKDLVAADFNGDGILDLVVANAGSGNLSLLLGQASGGFGAATTIAMGSGGRPGGLKSADLNNDGRPDLAVTDNLNQTVQVFLNAAGNLQTPTSYGLNGGINPQGLDLQDLNGDGWIDIVTANQNSNNLSLLISQNGTNFNALTPLSTGAGPLAVIASDLSNDGKVDLVSLNSLDNSYTFRSGLGDGNFNPPANPVSTSTGPMGMDTGDYNSDTLLDLSIACLTANRINIFLQNP
jgi:hypothetical protein